MDAALMMQVVGIIVLRHHVQPIWVITSQTNVNLASHQLVTAYLLTALQLNNAQEPLSAATQISIVATPILLSIQMIDFVTVMVVMVQHCQIPYSRKAILKHVILILLM